MGHPKAAQVQYLVLLMDQISNTGFQINEKLTNVKL